ncbi:hypothetical protein DICVIV_01732 [Dictyocaulus viviparus]|uniref:Uncharacterized protein n=1 Tax=Dictyocaulus viviparus TaxID=29172 RepID=A0A0D8YBT1_DICVI|nr:hypothetical protein DICVIV_01732 [Dictyocaulus viviparus]
MENHWLLPSISPLLSLTAQEFEKSRENSISVDPKSADDALQLIRNEHASRDNARSNNGIYDSGKKNSKVSEEPLERLLNDAEENIVQLERQLHMVQRKTNENEKLNESTRKRVDQLLYRLSSTAHSMQKEDTRNHDEELKRKLTMNSDLSLARIEDNTHKCTRERSEIEPEAQAETKINEDPQSDKDANSHKEMPVDHSDANNIGATEENSSCSQIIDDLHVDEELNQIYWECTRLLGRPKYMSYDCKDETVVVKKKLILEIMDCIRKLMTALIAQKNEINVNCNSEDGDETCSNLLSDAFSESKKNNSSMINEEKDVKNLTVRDITAEKHEHHQLTKIHEKDENISENAEENKGVELEEFSNAEHKNEDNNDKERSKDGCDKKNERQALDGSIDKEHALQVKIIEIPLELNNEVTQSYENTSNGNHESRVVSFEDGSPNRNDLHRHVQVS